MSASRRQPRQPVHPFLRGLLITAWSVASWAWIGLLVIARPGSGLILDALIIGGAIGMFLSPLANVLLWRAPLARVTLWFLPPASLLALFTRLLGDPIIAIVTIPFFVTLLILIRLVMPRRAEAIPPGICTECGYDTTGLVRCPECGTPCPMHVDLRTAP